MTDERWKPVVGYEDRYEVSDQGRVRSSWILKSTGVPSYRIRSLGTTEKGYKTVGLVDGNGGFKVRRVHHLVLEAFGFPRPEGLQTLHIDDDKANNSLANLKWGTSSENNYHQVESGNHFNASKTHCKWGHEYVVENTLLPSMKGGPITGRRCRTCYEQRLESKRTGVDVEIIRGGS